MRMREYKSAIQDVYSATLQLVVCRVLAVFRDETLPEFGCSIQVSLLSICRGHVADT